MKIKYFISKIIFQIVFYLKNAESICAIVRNICSDDIGDNGGNIAELKLLQ